jgi:TolB protein
MILRDLVADVPAHDAEARAEVWRRLDIGQPRRRWSQPRVLVLGGVAVVLALATAALTLRSSGIGVAPAEAACPANASSVQCARAMAAILLPSRSGEMRTGSRRIAFSLFQSPTQAGIYTMNTGGGDVRRLTNGPGRAAFPSWSPDGTRIAFDWTGRGTASGIYVMNFDGSEQRLLATGPWAVPSWSPDGSKIVFWREDGIYLVDRDGSDLHIVARHGWSPSWSPGGTKIVYTEGDRIYSVNSDGTGQRLLAHGYFPAWSPDGKTIAFHSTTQFGDHTRPVWIMNADGSDQRSLNVRAWVDCPLGWAPGGRLTVSNPAGLFLVRPVGGGMTELSGADICGAAWQPPER